MRARLPESQRGANGGPRGGGAARRGARKLYSLSLFLAQFTSGVHATRAAAVARPRADLLLFFARSFVVVVAVVVSSRVRGLERRRYIYSVRRISVVLVYHIAGNEEGLGM